MSVLDNTHEVLNQVRRSVDVQRVRGRPRRCARRSSARAAAGAWTALRDTGAVAGSAEAQEHGRRAERNEPRLLTHDRYGHRIDQVELDPSWHWLLRGGVEREIHALPWRDPQPGRARGARGADVCSGRRPTPA